MTTATNTRLGTIAIAPLRDGDTQTVQAVYEALGERSRRYRFRGARNELQPRELGLHARVGPHRHVLVARAGCGPVALAHLVRDDDSTSAEVAIAVADAWQRAGVGLALARRLVGLC